MEENYLTTDLAEAILMKTNNWVKNANCNAYDSSVEIPAENEKNHLLFGHVETNNYNIGRVVIRRSMGKEDPQTVYESSDRHLVQRVIDYAAKCYTARRDISRLVSDLENFCK